MNHYRLAEDRSFIIRDYENTSPFASFLPGVAGVDGIPMWVYYVNRGQAVVSFGIENKEHAMLDFTPANMSYKRAETEGFRTFIKAEGNVYPLFSSLYPNGKNRVLKVENYAVSLEEFIPELNISVTVRYTTLSHTSYPGLVRQVSFKNHNKAPVKIEFVDGLGVIWPYGTGTYAMKNMSNLAVAWFDVFNLENKIPYYLNRSTTGDTAIVEAVQTGNFVSSVDAKGKQLDIIVDNYQLFGESSSLLNITPFATQSIRKIIKQPQVTTNQFTAAWTVGATTLEDTYTFSTLFGRMDSLDQLHATQSQWTKQFFANVFPASQAVVQEITRPAYTKTADNAYDSYVEQCYLDNTLRGGTPMIFEGKNAPLVYHVYSRIHGDMEREYNNYSVEPSFYSQGNGSFRDVNQNRRNDVYFEPEAGLYNVKQFYELIQLDGHNPLSIRGSKFTIASEDLPQALACFANPSDAIVNLLKKPFTPGQLMNVVVQKKEALTLPQDQLVPAVLRFATQEMDVIFGTGYWSDHWTYNQDLLDNYLHVYPDQEEKLYFQSNFRFYQSPMTRLPRHLRSVQLPDGRVRQLDPIFKDEEKMKQCGVKMDTNNFHKTPAGNTVSVSFFVKLLHLGVIKTYSLDPFAMGLMMDGDKPGWNDAMNGLPGIFGSGVSETIELVRVVTELLRIVKKYPLQSIAIPTILFDLFTQLSHQLSPAVGLTPTQLVMRYNALQDIREQFDTTTRFTFDSPIKHLAAKEFELGLTRMLDVLRDGIERSKTYGQGLVPTFLTYEAVEFARNGMEHPHLHLPCVNIHSWSVRSLPNFLEAPARLLKQLHGAEADQLIDTVKASPLYDTATRMYVTSVPLDHEDLSIGRIRAFTAGWLEREANFMHMSYKFILGMLKSHRYDRFFEEIKDAFPCYMDPAKYGRSILENSSFIATSRNPNPRIHGKGYVARLTGTTAELLSMHVGMFFGYHLFSCHNHVLSFHLHPVLPRHFFSAEGQVETILFGTIPLTYVTTGTSDYYTTAVKYELLLKGKWMVIEGSSVAGELAKIIRHKGIEAIRVTLKGDPHVHH